MRAQRVRGGESRIEMQTVKWTAEGMGNGKRQVFHDVKVYVSYGDMLVSHKGYGRRRS